MLQHDTVHIDCLLNTMISVSSITKEKSEDDHNFAEISKTVEIRTLSIFFTLSHVLSPN